MHRQQILKIKNDTQLHENCKVFYPGLIIWHRPKEMLCEYEGAKVYATFATEELAKEAFQNARMQNNNISWDPNEYPENLGEPVTIKNYLKRKDQ